jgi:hypothetical protein
MNEEKEEEARPSPEEPPVELSDEELGTVAGGRDASTGQATGRRQHKPFMITKWIDTASP